MNLDFGPFVADLIEPERVARCRELRAVAVLVLGAHHPIVGLLRRAETNADAFAQAAQMIEAMPTLKMRHLLTAVAVVRAP
jgi:hypothetical protein